MPVALDIAGQKFGRLTALTREHERTTGGKIKWKCICECGKEVVVPASALKLGNTTSCGCKRTDTIREVCTTHGMCDSPEYQIWAAMKARCSYERHKDFHSYGGRGIKVCDRWTGSFEAFYQDMGPRPTPAHSIERREVDANYSPDNCYWATALQQARNKTNTRYVSHRGKLISLKDASELLSVDYDKLKYRLNLGYSLEQAVEEINDTSRPKRIKRNERGVCDV